MVTNVPRLNDVRTMRRCSRRWASRWTRGAGHRRARRPHVDWPLAPYELVKTMRASILVLGPLVARFGEAACRCRAAARSACAGRPAPQGPGGDGRRDRPRARLHQRAARRLAGTRFVFDVVTVTGTENLLMAATLAEGTTMLENAAREPEVVELARCLVAMGAKIAGRAPTHRDRGGRRAARRDARDHARPHRDRHVHRGDRGGGRRRDAYRRRGGHARGRARQARRGRRRHHGRGDAIRVARRGPLAPSTSARRRIPVSRPTCRRR